MGYISIRIWYQGNNLLERPLLKKELKRYISIRIWYQEKIGTSSHSIDTLVETLTTD